jgi:hypothetical protein
VGEVRRVAPVVASDQQLGAHLQQHHDAHQQEAAQRQAEQQRGQQQADERAQQPVRAADELAGQVRRSHRHHRRDHRPVRVTDPAGRRERPGDQHRDHIPHDVHPDAPLAEQRADPRPLRYGAVRHRPAHPAQDADDHREGCCGRCEERGRPDLSRVPGQGRAGREGEHDEQRSRRVPVLGVGEQGDRTGQQRGERDREPGPRIRDPHGRTGRDRGDEHHPEGQLHPQPAQMHPVGAVERGKRPERGIDRPLGTPEKLQHEQRHQDREPHPQRHPVCAGMRRDANQRPGA